MTTGNEKVDPIYDRLEAIEKRLMALEQKTIPLNVYGHHRVDGPSESQRVADAIALVKRMQL